MTLEGQDGKDMWAGEDVDESSPVYLVAVWDRSGQFATETESAERLSEFLAAVSQKTGQGADVDGIVALGKAFAKAGRATEMRLVVDCLAKIFHASASESEQEQLVEGMLSIGDTLLDENAPEDAVEVFTLVASLLDGAPYSGLNASLAAALFDRGFALKAAAYVFRNASMMEDAISTFSELERRFGGRHEPPFEVLVAQGEYDKGGALGALGQIGAATTCFSRLATRYSHSADEALKEVAVFATVRQHMMLAIPDAPPYIRVDQFYRTGVVPSDAAADDEAAEAWGEAALDSHRRASNILMSFRNNATPFALMLRSFDPEGFAITTGPNWTAETGLEPHVVTWASTQPSSLEQQAVEALGDTALVGVANRDALFDSAWIIPRLFLPDEGWKDIVTGLIKVAHFIIIGVEAITAGVQWELEQLRRSGRVDSTLVVLDTAGEDVDTGIRRSLRPFAARAEAPANATKASAELSGFGRIIYDTEIPSDGLGSLPIIADLLSDMQAITRLDPEARLRRLAQLGPTTL